MYLSGGVMDPDRTHCLACVGDCYEVGARLVVGFVLSYHGQSQAIM
jgi:hypothetical protein